MVLLFHNQESEYETFLAEAPAFVCNNLDTGLQYHRLHKSECNTLNRAGPARFGLHTSVKKAGSHELAELVRWLSRNYGSEGEGFTYCRHCFNQYAPVEREN